MIEASVINEYHSALPFKVRAYLNERHISNDIIDALKIGWGQFAGHEWIVFPILDASGNCIYLKLKRPPDAPDSQPKGMVHPAGSEATLYPLPYLTQKTEEVVVCEGEPDCLALMTHGASAVTSTAGAQTFKEEWLQWFPEGCRVVLCFDLDEAGQAGLSKVRQLFEEKRPDIRLGVVNYTAALLKWGKDVTDWFLNPLLGLQSFVRRRAVPQKHHE